jgi:transcriptional regulator with XRE-family HTH domain
MEERVTIRELARRSGVSVGTVSRALNGYADVRPETRERIMRLASELDYTPAAAARSLVTQRSHVIGVFLETGEGHPDLQHPFFHEVLGGLKQRVGAAGFDLLLFASERPGNGYGPHSYLKRARHHNVDGCALIGLDPDDAEVRRLGRSVLESIGFSGVVKMDFKRDARTERLYLLEINPRFNLWHHLGAVAGVNLPALVHADLTGTRRPAGRHATRRVTWCTPLTDLRAAHADGMSPLRWVRWARHCDVLSSLSRDDPLPFVRGTLASAAGRRLPIRRLAA